MLSCGGKSRSYPALRARDIRANSQTLCFLVNKVAGRGISQARYNVTYPTDGSRLWIVGGGCGEGNEIDGYVGVRLVSSGRLVLK